MSKAWGKRFVTFSGESVSGTVIYRRHFERLLAYPKPLRDQLIVELPTLNGLRAGEVLMVRREDVDFERGDLYVLDSKKHELCPIPLDLTVADHLDKLTSQEGIDSGFVFRRIHNAGRKGRGPCPPTLSWVTIEGVWKKYCRLCGIPVMPPRYGRAYFALNWHVLQRKSLMGLMRILRHDNLGSTEHYLSKLYFYEDIRNEFYQGQQTPFVSACSRSAACPVASEGCHCRMFQPATETIPTRQPVS